MSQIAAKLFAFPALLTMPEISLAETRSIPTELNTVAETIDSKFNLDFSFKTVTS